MKSLTRQEMLTIELPAWAPLLVCGDRVTPDQAAEILIRTDNFYFSTRDQEWERVLNLSIGVTQDVWTGTYEERVKALEARDRARIRFRLLHLYYLRNRRVAASTTGPHGWVHWDGTVACNNYTIGKHATVEEVYDDWFTIAREWPFLRIQCQLLDSYSHPSRSMVDFTIDKGRVIVQPPTSILVPYEKHLGEWASVCSQPPSERGCTLEQFQHGLRLAEGS